MRRLGWREGTVTTEAGTRTVTWYKSGMLAPDTRGSQDATLQQRVA